MPYNPIVVLWLGTIQLCYLLSTWPAARHHTPGHTVGSAAGGIISNAQGCGQTWETGEARVLSEGRFRSHQHNDTDCKVSQYNRNSTQSQGTVVSKRIPTSQMLDHLS